MSDANYLPPPASPAKSMPGDIAGENTGRASQNGAYLIQQQSLTVPPNAQSMRYGDLVYLHVENVDGIV